MRTWNTQTTVPGSPSAVLDLLTEPDAIAEWAPVPFEIVSLAGRRLDTGTRARVRGTARGTRGRVRNHGVRGVG